jgi:hypothetical protein
MPMILIFVAVILIVAAWNNSQGTLASNLAADATGFAKWFAALAVVGGLQWVPGLQTIARWLIGLMLLVLVVTKYQQIFAGFTDLASTAGTAPAGPASPAAAYVANPSNPQITQAGVAGTTGNVNAAQPASAPASPFDPHTLLANFTSAPGMLFSAAVMGGA